MTTSGTDGDPTVRTGGPPAWLALGVAAAVVVAARVVGTWDGVGDLSLGGPPMIGHWDLSIPLATAVPTAFAILVVLYGPRVSEVLRWRALLLVSWLSSAAFATALAAVDGWHAVSEPLASRFEYRAVLPEIDRQGVGAFVRDFTENLPGYPTHVRGHPVGLPLLTWAQEQLLPGAGWSAAVAIGIGASAAATAAVATRHVVGESAARRAAPFLVVTPAVVWMATSADAIIMGTVVAAVAAFAVAVRSSGPRAAVWAAGAGGLGALALHLSYGAAVMLLPLVVLVVAERRWGLAVWACLAAAVVTGAAAAAGFWWFEGLEATRQEYERGAGGFRPYWYFATIGNPAAFMSALGPAIVVALTRLRDRATWILVGGALAGVVLANVSGLSKAEVERIWLPFVPLLTVAAAGFPRVSVRAWLGVQAAAAMLLQVTLESPW